MVCPRCGLLGDFDIYRWGDEVAFYCEPCDFTTPSGGGNPEQPGLIVPAVPYKGSLVVSARNWEVYSALVSGAAIAARSARFEHGESPVW